MESSQGGGEHSVLSDTGMLVQELTRDPKISAEVADPKYRQIFQNLFPLYNLFTT